MGTPSPYPRRLEDGVDPGDAPAQDRLTYAGVKEEVLEQSHVRLMVQHEGEVIAYQEALPRAGALRAAQGALAPTPELAQVLRNLSQHSLTRLQLQRRAILGALVTHSIDSEQASSSYTPPPREATPRKQALWKAAHDARLQGVSLRGIARELGISGNTVGKYVDSPAPLVNRNPGRSA